MVYHFVLNLRKTTMIFGLPNCFKVLSIIEASLEDFGFYFNSQVATQSNWPIANCPLWLDISTGTKSKFINLEKEEAFNLLKEEKVLANIVVDLLGLLHKDFVGERTIFLYKVAHNGETILGPMWTNFNMSH